MMQFLEYWMVIVLFMVAAVLSYWAVAALKELLGDAFWWLMAAVGASGLIAMFIKIGQVGW